MSETYSLKKWVQKIFHKKIFPIHGYRKRHFINSSFWGHLLQIFGPSITKSRDNLPNYVLAKNVTDIFARGGGRRGVPRLWTPRHPQLRHMTIWGKNFLYNFKSSFQEDKPFNLGELCYHWNRITPGKLLYVSVKPR